MAVWHDRLSMVGWFFEHLDDVLSDMSVFHRIDDLDDLPASVFLPRMVRLGLYDGAVRNAIRREVEKPSVHSPQAQASQAEQAAPVRPHTADEFKALNRSREYGPAGVNEAGVFDIG